MLSIVFLALNASGANAQDIEAGARLFAGKCQICHSVDLAKRAGLGPNLAGVVGRDAASLAGFPYSPAMAKSQIRWDAAKLDAFLAAPQRVVPGNRMAFPGLTAAADRAQVIAFLASKTHSTDQR
ncbi:c-type cytochrome [Sandarakinorhabdus cyanobacteriorum]|nr:c-type cytochrome [Sandarakinorhabdus cyanobacteriorum]